MTKLVLSRPGESVGIKPDQHIVIIGLPDWQDVIKGHLQHAFGGSKPIIECPEPDEVISQLGQFKPNLLIITNLDPERSLTLQQIVENSTIPRKNIVVLCDQVTRSKAELLGVRVIASKFELGKNLIPVVQELLS